MNFTYKNLGACTSIIIWVTWCSGVSAAINLGNVEYGGEKTSYYDVHVKGFLAPATTLRDTVAYAASYRYKIVIGHGRASAELQGRNAWEKMFSCGRTFSGKINGACYDRWNNATGNDGRCRSLIEHLDSWAPGTGVAVTGNDANAFADWIDRQMSENVARMRFPDNGRLWLVPGPQSQSVILDNDNVMIKWNPNRGADIKGVWCVQLAVPIGG